MTNSSTARPPTFSPTSAVIRYQIRDVERAVTFYTELGFHVVQRSGSMIAIVARGDLHLILSGAESSGARPMPDGQKQEPGGWNRVVMYVERLDPMIERLKESGTRFRNTVEEGPGGKQILIEDPDGNPIELHEAPR
jgi:catechol 2,3-dioxygenase-like lactoylglutathione lyase family enzyme